MPVVTLIDGQVFEILSTDVKPDEPDGSFLKELDTSILYWRISGVWVPFAVGFTFSRGAKAGQATTDGNGEASIAFGTDFVDTSYSIQITPDDQGFEKLAVGQILSRSTSGFVLCTRDKNGHVFPNVPVSWEVHQNQNA